MNAPHKQNTNPKTNTASPNFILIPKIPIIIHCLDGSLYEYKQKELKSYLKLCLVFLFNKVYNSSTAIKVINTVEFLDVFDELYTPLAPASVSIDEVHQKGLWHQTFACWLVNCQKGTVVLQLRGAKNRIDPNSFDSSAGGHLASGEKPADGFRELREELGMTIPEKDRFYLGLYRNIAIRHLATGTYINHEFCHVFLGRCDLPLDAFSLQQGEVNGVFEISIEEAIDLFTGKMQRINAVGLAWNGQEFVLFEKTVTEESMCNHQDRCQISKYYLKVMLAARGLLKNESILVI
jgi:isopentenyldiphosphate isomerase